MLANNLLDIEILVRQFLGDHQIGITTICKAYFRKPEQLMITSLMEEMIGILKTNYASLISKQYPKEEIDQHLFYVANEFIKNKSREDQSKIIKEYVCPACDNILKYSGQIFHCIQCVEYLKVVSDPKREFLWQTFSKHNKQGYRCPNCSKFIPYPLDGSISIVCPYLNCEFVGSRQQLKTMHHPSIKMAHEELIDDVALDEMIVDPTNPVKSLQDKQQLDEQVKLLKDIIDTLANDTPYSSQSFTIKHKLLCYRAFDNLLRDNAQEMVDYLIHNSRSGGFQHKIFQEYIRLLEASFPFIFKRGSKFHQIETLLDTKLGVFDGISTFETIVPDTGIIKNHTTEMYIGGRKSTVVRPYYIGKLLNIIDVKTKRSLLSRVQEYSFSLIKTDIVSGTQVIVSHLRIPPHYQMGGMVYVNRARQKIVEMAKSNN